MNGELMELRERVEFVHDTASAIAKDNVRNWRAPVLGWELRSHKLQEDIDSIVQQLGALVRGDTFETVPEFQEWRARRGSAIHDSRRAVGSPTCQRALLGADRRAVLPERGLPSRPSGAYRESRWRASLRRRRR